MTDIEPTKFADYVFPGWADAGGWLIGASTLMPFAGFLLYRLIKGPVSVCVHVLCICGVGWRLGGLWDGVVYADALFIYVGNSVSLFWLL